PLDLPSSPTRRSSDLVVASASREVAARSAQTDTVTAVLEVTNPRVWSVDSPNLYQLTTTLLQDGRTIDETTTRTGFRTFTFDPRSEEHTSELQSRENL